MMHLFLRLVFVTWRNPLDMPPGHSGRRARAQCRQGDEAEQCAWAQRQDSRPAGGAGERPAAALARIDDG